MSARLYVEGGGDSKTLRIECRHGFSGLLRKAGLSGRMPRVVACGTRRSAYDDFALAAAQPRGGLPFLLVDAEAPVAAQEPWEHLRQRDGWLQPRGTDSGQCHLMVTVMESWFLADRGTLAAFYGSGYQPSALPANPSVEEIPKDHVLRGLKRASRATSKGSYRKGEHSFRLLALIDPRRIEEMAPFGRRFFTTLRVRLGAPERIDEQPNPGS